MADEPRRGKRPDATARVKLAAANPRRPGEDCKAETGSWVPVVDRSRCEGKHDCVDVCPYSVFEVRRIEPGDLAALGFFARLKVRAHRMQSAYTPGATDCRACGLCVVACPEEAIALVRR